MEAIARIGTIIVQINDIQSTIASAVEEQTATTAEIARNVAQAARGTADGAANARLSADALAKMPADLQRLSAELKA